MRYLGYLRLYVLFNLAFSRFYYAFLRCDCFSPYLKYPSGYKRHRKASALKCWYPVKHGVNEVTNRRLMDSRSGKRYVKRKNNRLHYRKVRKR